MTTNNAFRRLWDLGYHRLCPIVPPDAPLSEKSSLFKRLHAKKSDDARGKVPGIKWPDGSWSGFDFTVHESTEADLDRWSAMGAGVGIKVGRGLVLIDADTLNETWAKLIKEAIERIIGVLPVRIGQYPKAGYLVRTDPDFLYACLVFGERDDKGRLKERVEILSEGRQFVAVGTHPKTRKPYRWPQGVPALADVPYVPAALLLQVLDELRLVLPSAAEVTQEGRAGDAPANPAALRGDEIVVAKAMKAMRNTSEFFGRDEYVAVGYALRGALPDNLDLAFDLYSDWCARWEEGENDPDVVAAEWSRMKEQPRIGAGWLYDHAEQWPVPGAAFTKAEQWYEDIPDAPESIFQHEPPAPKRRYNFLPFAVAADGALQDSTSPLIKGLLDQGAMTVLYGPSNVGKTFAAMDISYHIAAGVPYAGMRVTRGAVLYVAAEGGRGAKRRVRALRDKYAAQGDDVQFFLLASSVDLRRPDADLKPLISAIRELGFEFVLIVIDTLSRAMAGGDENSSVDMGFIVNHFDALRAHTRAHLMVVHHSGKNAAAGARGHSLLRAATDTEIEVSEGLIEVTKQRDLDKSWSSGFALETRVLGVDGDGDPITSCTVQLMRREAVQVGTATPKEGEVLKAVSELDAFNVDGVEGVSVADLVTYFGQSEDALSEESVRSMLKRLVAKNLVDKCGRGRWRQNVQKSPEKVVRNGLTTSDSVSRSAEGSGESGQKVVNGVFE